MKLRRNNNRAFTLIELLVVMSIIALLLGILLPALSKARAKARQVKDSTQLSQLHKGLVTYASDKDGIFLTPGLVKRHQRLVLGGDCRRRVAMASARTSTEAP